MEINDGNQRWNSEKWTQPSASQTWTYKLYRKFMDAAALSVHGQNRQSIKVKIRGPYGSPFSKCFQSIYPAVVVIGAGTGLTSALSVLKEMIYRHMTNQSRQLVWFVWSCSRVDDLIMCWRTLHELLYEAFNLDIFHMPSHWNPLTSPMLDWLSITIYVTRGDRKQLGHFLNKFVAPLSNHNSNPAMITETTLQCTQAKRGSAPKLARDDEEATIFSMPARFKMEPSIRKKPDSRAKDLWRSAAKSVTVANHVTSSLLSSVAGRSFPGDYVICKSESVVHSYRLALLLDAGLNQFEHHTLSLLQGTFAVDGKLLSPPACLTLPEALHRLSLAPEHISLPLRQPAPVGLRQDYMTEAVKHYHLLTGKARLLFYTARRCETFEMDPK